MFGTEPLVPGVALAGIIGILVAADGVIADGPVLDNVGEVTAGGTAVEGTGHVMALPVAEFSESNR
jgi:hypothetical protein